MRVLVVGSAKDWRMEAGIARAMTRAGHTVRLVDDKRARRALGRRLVQRWALWHRDRFRPDFVVLSKCQGLTLETVRELVRDTPNALWYLDAPWYKHPELPHIAHLIEVGKLARTFFVSGYVDEWRALGANARYLPAAGDRDIVPVARHPRYAADLTFIGTGYAPERAEFLVALAREFSVKVWGSGWEQWRDQLDWGGRAVEGRDFARACSSAGVTLGINPPLLGDAAAVASNRMWISILAGGFYLGRGTPGMEALLKGDEHCAWYTDLDSCVAQARRYLADPAARERVRAAGEKFVREHHTFDQRAVNILEDREWVSPLSA